MAQMQMRGSTQIQAGTISWDRMASGAIVPTASLVDGANFLKKDGSVTLTAALNLGGFAPTNSASPVNANDVANKAYVDNAAFGFHFKGAKVLGSANVALTGLQAIDGYTLVAGDRVLLTGQTTSSQNGLWVAASGSWTRPSDYAAASVQTEGIYVFLDPDGATYGNTKWRCTNTGNITVDTTSTVWTQDTSGASYSNGAGLSLTGSTFAVKTGNGVSFDGSNNVTISPDGARLMQVTASGVGIKDGTAAQIIMANASGNASYQSVTGDVSITSGGVTTVNNAAGSGFTKYTNFVYNETPTGTVNGTTTTFTLAATPQQLSLYVNGQKLKPGAGNDYTLSGATITMLSAPLTGDQLLADYTK